MSQSTPIPIGRYHTLRDGLRIHFTEVGTPRADRPSILCLHGGGPGASGYSNYKKNLPHFERCGYHALAPDLPGFGLSDKPDDIDYSSRLHVSAMRELIESLGVQTVIPLGNSLGGSVALEYTLAFPQSVPRLILMAPGGLVDPKTFWGQTEGGRAVARFANERPAGIDAFRDMMRLLVRDGAIIDDELLAERHPIALSQPSRVFTSVSIQPTWERLHELPCPVLCFWGAQDRFLPPEQAFVLLKNSARAKVVLSNGAGHWYMLEQPDDFNREVIDFIAHGD